jgi:hypothetical protein
MGSVEHLPSTCKALGSIPRLKGREGGKERGREGKREGGKKDTRKEGRRVKKKKKERKKELAPNSSWCLSKVGRN